MESRTHLKEQLALPVSALRFQDCCFAQSATPDSLIKGLKEWVACYLSSANLQADGALQPPEPGELALTAATLTAATLTNVNPLCAWSHTRLVP